jgi:hypothetical protein
MIFGSVRFEFGGGSSSFDETGSNATIGFGIDMKMNESKCAHQTMSLFGDEPKIEQQPVNTTGKVEILFDASA